VPRRKVGQLLVDDAFLDIAASHAGGAFVGEIGSAVRWRRGSSSQLADRTVTAVIGSYAAASDRATGLAPDMPANSSRCPSLTQMRHPAARYRIRFEALCRNAALLEFFEAYETCRKIRLRRSPDVFDLVEIVAVAFGLHPVARNEAERGRVDAVAQATAVRRAIFEDVPEVAVAMR
jgi:hypothetical protein